jgi:hypothetical protein
MRHAAGDAGDDGLREPAALVGRIVPIDGSDLDGIGERIGGSGGAVRFLSRLRRRRPAPGLENADGRSGGPQEVADHRIHPPDFVLRRLFDLRLPRHGPEPFEHLVGRHGQAQRQALGRRTIRRPKRRGHVVLPEQTDQCLRHTTPPTIAGASSDDVQAHAIGSAMGFRSIPLDVCHSCVCHGG